MENTTQSRTKNVDFNTQPSDQNVFMRDKKPYLSVIVPLFNEEGNARELHQKIVEACQNLGRTFEIVFIDDGSKDKTNEICRSLHPLKLITFRKNFGQTAAFDAGIKNSTGEIIITMDGDLQNDPADIKLLIEKIGEGCDVVSGWRVKRHDSFSKRFFSRVANVLRKILIDDGIHDSGCSLKAYRRECFDDLDLYGEMHRFIPALLKVQGFKVAEIPVSHHPRKHGVTKYNWKRGVKGIVDMISVWFWKKYANRPLHLFGAGGLIIFSLGIASGVALVVARVFYAVPMSNKIWPLIAVFMVLMGIQLFIFGLLADIAVKNYYKAQGKMNYKIREIVEN
ncbi:MAG: glycosyltransferase family 2 protein [Candidatus Moranbacteria bacterium]|nr:glycosyltransferase family 2 protein [Candidatus Moranbacteria bacterium]